MCCSCLSFLLMYNFANSKDNSIYFLAHPSSEPIYHSSTFAIHPCMLERRRSITTIPRKKILPSLAKVPEERGEGSYTQEGLANSCLQVVWCHWSRVAFLPAHICLAHATITLSLCDRPCRRRGSPQGLGLGVGSVSSRRTCNIITDHWKPAGGRCLAELSCIQGKYIHII